MSLPKISIITPSLNQGKYIEENIQSVIAQNYSNFEHIVVDGGSTDTTVEILKKYNHIIWISEEDKGQSDALNKGLRMASGEIIGWLNSDDYYLPNTFNDIVKKFQKDLHIFWIIGKIVFFNMKKKEERKFSLPQINSTYLRYKSVNILQPSTFYKKSVIDDVGGFDENLNYVMDYDLWLKISKKSNPLMSEEAYTVFRIHPEQKTTFINAKKQLKELRIVSKRHHARIAFFKKLIMYYKSFIINIIKTLTTNIIRFFLYMFYYAVAQYLPKSTAKFKLFGKISQNIRLLCGRVLFLKCGAKVNIERKAKFGMGHLIEIGDFSGIGRNCTIPNDIKIGNYVIMAPDVLILSENHNFKDTNVPMYLQGHTERICKIIEDDVWIGQRVIILPNVHKIAKGSILGAGAVITKDVPPYSIVVGNPGRIVKTRK